MNAYLLVAHHCKQFVLLSLLYLFMATTAYSFTADASITAATDPGLEGFRENHAAASFLLTGGKGKAVQCGMCRFYSGLMAGMTALDEKVEFLGYLQSSSPENGNHIMPLIRSKDSGNIYVSGVNQPTTTAEQYMILGGDDVEYLFISSDGSTKLHENPKPSEVEKTLNNRADALEWMRNKTDWVQQVQPKPNEVMATLAAISDESTWQVLQLQNKDNYLAIKPALQKEAAIIYEQIINNEGKDYELAEQLLHFKEKGNDEGAYKFQRVMTAIYQGC